MLNFRITDCQVLFIQKHKLFLTVASYCHISQKVRINHCFQTAQSCSNAAVRHKHTAQFSQSKPTSTHKLSETRAHFKWLLYATASATITQNAAHRKNTLHVSLWCWCAYKILHNRSQPAVNSWLLFPEWGGICRNHISRCDVCWTSVRYWSSCWTTK